MIVTQKLGFQYMWVDALCIIQQDAEDWSKEASRMCSVCQNAVLTLAASDGPNSHTRRDWLPVGKLCNLARHLSHDQSLPSKESKTVNMPSSCSKSPLMKRGWVYQERMLSRRYLMFGKELVWECHESLSVSAVFSKMPVNRGAVSKLPK
ncbi:heterokaryon incompatibility protein-domain-containing protein [Halenospora varia]|nr:heterokaryon incompatibility protein-domain-containing protein [Halenospora varia]